MGRSHLIYAHTAPYATTYCMDLPVEWHHNLIMPLDLTDAELATAATACRAMAYQEGERSKKMENPTTRGPIEAASKRYAVLAQKLEAAEVGTQTGAAVGLASSTPIQTSLGLRSNRTRI